MKEFLSVNVQLTFLLSFLYIRVSKRKCLFIPILKRWPVNILKSFFNQSFQRLHFPS